VTQITNLYPPFELATITILVMTAFLMLLGIYNSAILISANNELRKSIYKHSVESRLLNLTAHAEIKSSFKIPVRKISKDKKYLTDGCRVTATDRNKRSGVEKYLDLVIREVKSGQKQ
jgi:hypothetical protein